jgi:hypothetical protein
VGDDLQVQRQGVRGGGEGGGTAPPLETISANNGDRFADNRFIASPAAGISRVLCRGSIVYIGANMRGMAVRNSSPV